MSKRPVPSRRGKRKRKTVHTCRGKRRFRDKMEADAARHITRNYSTRQTIPVRSYFCDRCNGWHLTSKAFRG